MAETYETTELHELDQVYTIDNNTLLLVSKDGTEYKFTYEDLFRRVEQHLNEDTFSIHSNAKYFDGIPVKSDGTEQDTVMMYREDINSYVPKIIVPSHIDWSDSITGEGWLRINSLNELESDQVKVSDIVPSSDYSDYENRFLILRVSDNGEFIYEYDLDVSDFITQPQDNVDDLNDIVGNQYKVGNITQNRPNNDDGYLLNLKSDHYDSQSQLFLSTDSNKIRYRYHNTTDFQDWVTIYNNSENPLSDSIENDSSEHIATSKAVNTLKNDLDDYKNLLTPNYFLNEIIKVDGANSELNADKLDDLEGSEFATMFENTNISKLPENSIRFNHNTSIFEKKYNGEWNNLQIDGSNITTATNSSKGTVKFSNEQQSIDGNDSVAASPENVYTIIKKYGLSVNDDPGEEITDADIAFTTGFYRLPSHSSGNPYNNSCSLVVYRPGVNNWVHQIAYRGDSTRTSVRTYNGFSWSEWSEYINTDITGTTGLEILKSETQEDARLNIGLDVGDTGFDLIESETPNDARTALNISEDDSVEFDNVTINGNDVFHKGIMTITDTRTSTTEGDVLSAKGMHDHIHSGDHDSRYYTQDEVEKLIAEATATPTGGIIMWSGLIGNIPAGWALCDGTNGTPNLQDRFIVGAGNNYSLNDTGGMDEVQLDTDQIPSHNHDGSTNEAGQHKHKGSTDTQGKHRHQLHGNDAQRNGQSDAVGIYQDDKESRYDHTNQAGEHSHNIETDTSGQHSHTVTTEDVGGDQPHENRPPYYALAFIMKL